MTQFCKCFNTDNSFCQNKWTNLGVEVEEVEVEGEEEEEKEDEWLQYDVLILNVII